MNFFEKIKLRAQLRNCNYELAGTVLKQQFYDYDKNTELNRLIDHLIENPDFESALKIIKFNELYVFYFTESCHEGLYVRKNDKSAATVQEPVSRVSEEKEEVVEEDEAMTDENSMQHLEQENSHLPKAIETIEQHFAALEMAVTRSPQLNYQTEEEEEQPLPNVESQQVEEQTESDPEEQFHTAEQSYEEDKLEENIASAEEAYATKPATEQYLKTTLNYTKQYEETTDSAKKESLKESIKKSLKKLVREVTSSTEQSSAKEEGTELQTNATPTTDEQLFATGEIDLTAQADQQEPIEPERSRFTNVINTIQIDIEEMKRQREEFQQMIYQNDPSAVKFKRWIVALDEAIEEFESAVRLLNRIRK